MSAEFLDIAISVAFLALLFAGTCTFVRLLRGPAMMDRVVALDVLSVISVAMIMVTAIQSEQPALIDVALALALVAFLATVALARFLEERSGDE